MSKSMRRPMPTQPKESETVSSMTPLSTPISKHSLIQDDVSFLKGLRMSLPEVSPAKTSPLPTQSMEYRPGLKGNGVAYGKTWQQSLVWLDRSTSLWRIRQCSLLGGWEPFSETWPAWGIMQHGECFVLPTLALSTLGRGSGYWPTPLASDGIAWKKNKKSDVHSSISKTLKNLHSDQIGRAHV